MKNLYLSLFIIRSEKVINKSNLMSLLTLGLLIKPLRCTYARALTGGKLHYLRGIGHANQIRVIDAFIINDRSLAQSIV